MANARTTDRAVADYLAERQKLIVLLMKLTSATEERQQDLVVWLRVRLCEAAVDYVSHGYFRVYGHLVSTQTWREAHAYAAFESTTATVLGFNDRFAAPGPIPHTRLKPALTDLALALETRFALEDQLFAGVTHKRTSRPRQAVRSLPIQPTREVAFAT
jgi:regulator of sigma D